jgi:hypothetical protein
LDHRGTVDFAQVIKHLVDDLYPHAEEIVLVMDILNTHSPGSLYEVFEPAEAKRLADKLEIHYTPKHGSWLNMAEDRTECAEWPMLGPPYSRRSDFDGGGHRLEPGPQYR